MMKTVTETRNLLDVSKVNLNNQLSITKAQKLSKPFQATSTSPFTSHSISRIRKMVFWLPIWNPVRPYDSQKSVRVCREICQLIPVIVFAHSDFSFDF